MRHLRTIPLMAAATVAALASAVMPDRTLAAETTAPPAHLTAYNLDWLNYIAPEDLPPTRYAVCIVDSGVAVTPDTPPDDPAGPILRRLATDGGSGEPQGTAEEQLHGTRMAMSAIAPMNDWGTIGTWTGGRVVSVRAMVEGETTFRAEAYRSGIDACLSQNAEFPLAAIGLALGCAACDFSEEELALLRERVVRASRREITIFAAAGNTYGSAVQMPAANEGVMAIAAGAPSGELCSYASYGPKVSHIGPGCPVETAEPLTGVPQSMTGGGSSIATATTAVFASALRSLRPDSSKAQVEAWLRAGTTNVDGRPVLHGGLVARAAGLESVLMRAQQRMHAESAPPSAGAAAIQESAPVPMKQAEALNPRRRLPRPRVESITWQAKGLRISLRAWRSDACLEISAYRARGEFGTRRLGRRAFRSSPIAFRARRRPDEVQLRWLPRVRHAEGRLPSQRAVLRRDGLDHR